MKKIFALGIAAVLSFALFSACAHLNDGAEPANSNPLQSADPASSNPLQSTGDSLYANKGFIMVTFARICENTHVQLSSTVETSKTFEPELYNSMLSRGEDILPAALDLIADHLVRHDQGRRTAELSMLCNDILENMGKSPISGFTSDCKECLLSDCKCYLCYDYSVSFGSVYESYLGKPPPRILSSSELGFEEEANEQPSYVWWEEADPSVYIPEPSINPDNPPPDYMRWEPMLGSYIYRDAYYNEELGWIVLEKFPDAPEEVDCLCSFCN